MQIRSLLRGRPSWATAAVLSFALPAAAQCELQWQPDPSPAGPVGSVEVLLQHPNGDLIAAGSFRVAGSIVANNIARFDGSEWHSLGGGVSSGVVGVGGVRGAAFLPNGDLMVVGNLTEAGGNPVNHAAIWDGTSWSSAAGGLDGEVRDLALLSTGEVVVVGDFDQVGGLASNGVARWSGATWSAIGTGPTINYLSTVAVGPGDEIYVAGYAGQSVPDVEQWDGTAWTALPGIAPSQITTVRKLLVLPNGNLVISAAVTGVGTVELGIYNGTSLQSLQSPLPPGSIRVLAAGTNGDLLVGGGNAFSSLPTASLQRYDGATWSPLGGPEAGQTSAVLLSNNGAVFVCRKLKRSAPYGGLVSSSVAELVGSDWVPLDGGLQHVATVETLASGDVVGAGEFAEIGGVAANNIARWDGQSFHALGLGVDGPVTALAVAPDGSLIVGGDFATAGGAPAGGIARWDGFSWTTLGAGLPGFGVRGLAINQNGEVLALPLQPSQDGVRLFDGQNWSSHPAPIGNANDILTLPSGDFLLVGRWLALDPFGVYGAVRFAGGSFTFEPAFLDWNVYSGLVEDSGDVLICGGFQGNRQLARLAGGTLTQLVGLLPSSVDDLAVLPNGDVLLAGSVTQTPLFEGGLLRFDGTALSVVDGGLEPGRARSIAISGAGEVIVVGEFVTAGGHASVGLARAATPCPAGVASFGAGCIGSAGPVTLTSDELPWIGSTLNATAMGLAAQSPLALHAVGVTSGVSPLPLGAAGCSLFLAPLFTEVLLPQNGEASARLTIPASPLLVGANVFSQVIGLELSPSQALVQTTSSNALQLTIGAF